MPLRLAATFLAAAFVALMLAPALPSVPLSNIIGNSATLTVAER